MAMQAHEAKIRQSEVFYEKFATLELFAYRFRKVI